MTSTLDQYADGLAARHWNTLIGDARRRENFYKNFVVDLLRRNGCRRVLDAACGTGIDSSMLLEEGFEVVSVDASDKMLKQALRTRWERRRERAFDEWVIEEANWLTLTDDISNLIGDGFDAVICLGNSFAHILDHREQKQALAQFERCVKPGGIFLIDHRNYDRVIATGKTPLQCVYYNCKHLQRIDTTILFTNGKPTLVTLDYSLGLDDGDKNRITDFRLTYYPHELESFTKLLNEVFYDKIADHAIYGDFKRLDEIEHPGVYVHVLEKMM